MPGGMNFLESISATVLSTPGTVAYRRLFSQIYFLFPNGQQKNNILFGLFKNRYVWPSFGRFLEKDKKLYVFENSYRSEHECPRPPFRDTMRKLIALRLLCYCPVMVGESGAVDGPK